ncbi:MAG: ATP synthase A1 subunit C [Actinomycetota bacterium]|nr:ATP synthase A1 subunit C [Actinomycetota bacterium]
MTTIEYGYACARIRAMKGRLLDRAFFERLIGMKNLTEVVVALERTTYKKDVHEAILQAPGAEGVENGLRHNIIDTFTVLREVVDGGVRELVDILLGRWDVQNLKTILRGLHQAAGRDQIISSLVPAGAIGEAALDELAGQIDVRACLNLMATWSMPYAGLLTEVYSRYAQELRLQIFEFALDKFYFEESLKKLNRRSLDAGLVREVIMREIDLVNIMTLLRLTRGQAPAERKMELFLEGGKQVSNKLYAKLAAMHDIDDIVAGMPGSSFAKSLEHGWEGFLASGSFYLIERALEAHLIGVNVRLFRADPLSVAIIIAYIWAKLNEVVNLRIVVRGQAVGMPEEKIRQALVFV